MTRPDTVNLRHDNDPQVRCYRSQFSDQMEMMSESDQVEQYLDRHQGWFERCAAPMRVHPIDAQSYDLTLGKFGNFGFEVEPTIALRLLPQHKGHLSNRNHPSNPQSARPERALRRRLPSQHALNSHAGEW